jgi:diguanylate cyclase (GGDEF)-like protein
VSDRGAEDGAGLFPGLAVPTRKAVTDVASSEPDPDPVSGPDPASHPERPTDRLRELMRDIRSSDVVLLADRITSAYTDPYEVARAYLMKLGALINLRRTAECPAVVDQADLAVRRAANPALLGEYHALAGFVSYAEGSLDRGVMHLVWANRALERVQNHDLVSADAWGDLANVYSFLGFHDHARRAVSRARQAAEVAGLAPSDHVLPDVWVRAAVALDHRGDTESCRDQLVELLTLVRSLLAETGGLSALRPDHLPYVEYAVVRLSALGHVDATLPLPRLRAMPKTALPEIADLRALSAVCQAIAKNHTDEALAMLDRATVDPRTLGGAEVHRLRSLAHATAGRYVEADISDRAAFRIAEADLDRIRGLFVDGIAVRLDHEELRRTVGRYAGEALSDPLTGLANRRSLEQRIDQMSRDREAGVLGVVDLDAFKAVNTVHGHLTGDLVLQRVATVLIRTLRRRDFVARYGGDEFVVILPSTTLAEAEAIGDRLVAAIRSEDWESIVPGTPVSASAGWAELREDTDLVDAFRKADRTMLDAKQRTGLDAVPPDRE